VLNLPMSVWTPSTPRPNQLHELFSRCLDSSLRENTDEQHCCSLYFHTCVSGLHLKLCLLQAALVGPFFLWEVAVRVCPATMHPGSTTPSRCFPTPLLLLLTAVSEILQEDEPSSAAAN